MIKDTVSIIAGHLSNLDIHRCRRVSREWSEMFANRQFKVEEDSSIIYKEPYYFLLARKRVCFGGSFWSFLDRTHLCEVSIRGTTFRNWCIRGQQLFDLVSDQLGDTLYILPVFTELSLRSRVKRQHVPSNMKERQITRVGEYSLYMDGDHLDIIIGDQLYCLYSPPYYINLAPRIVDVGFINVAGTMWCADAADVAAVGRLAYDWSIYVHVLTSVYFCACVWAQKLKSAALICTMSVTFDINGVNPAIHFISATKGEFGASGHVTVDRIRYKFTIVESELTSLMTATGGPCKMVFDEEIRNRVFASWLATFDKRA